MNVPILRLSFPESSRSFIARSFDEIASSGMLSSGRFTRQFEEMFSAFTMAPYAISCNSGTSALELIIRGLGIEGRSIIVPTNTFLATALAAMHAGNRIIFADCDPATFSLDVDDVRNRIEDDTAAIIVVHIGGVISPEIYQLQDLCRERNLYLIEDCAHAHGCQIDGKQAGTLGIAGAFSFFPTKVLTTGEGGMVTTADEGLAREIQMLRNHGKNPALSNHISTFGNNHRLSEITAAIGVEQMNRATELIQDRQRAASFYDANLQEIPGMEPVSLAEGASSSYYKYLVYLDEDLDRATIKGQLKERNVALTGEVYADLCHNEPIWETFTYCGHRRNVSPRCKCWPKCETRQDGFPNSDFLSRHHACLPVYPGLTEQELEYVTASLRMVLTERMARSTCA